jgi:hypothetical protein
MRASSAEVMAQLLAEKEQRRALAWFVDNAQLWRYDKSPAGPHSPANHETSFENPRSPLQRPAPAKPYRRHVA